MPISSYVIRCATVDLPGVIRQLRAIEGVEVGEPSGTGVPVVADTANTRAAARLGERLENLTGVKAAVLVYHNFEDLTDPAA